MSALCIIVLWFSLQLLMDTIIFVPMQNQFCKLGNLCTYKTGMSWMIILHRIPFMQKKRKRWNHNIKYTGILHLKYSDDILSLFYRPRPTQAFTPYSITLGGVVQELHRTLLLALAAEPHHTSCTQLLKALGLLVTNTSYHQLSEGYLSRVTATLERISTHKGNV